MSAGEQRNEQTFHHGVLANHDLSDALAHSLDKTDLLGLHGENSGAWRHHHRKPLVKVAAGLGQASAFGEREEVPTSKLKAQKKFQWQSSNRRRLGFEV